MGIFFYTFCFVAFFFVKSGLSGVKIRSYWQVFPEGGRITDSPMYLEYGLFIFSSPLASIPRDASISISTFDLSNWCDLPFWPFFFGCGLFLNGPPVTYNPLPSDIRSVKY